jgi:hypothetical protein
MTERTLTQRLCGAPPAAIIARNCAGSGAGVPHGPGRRELSSSFRRSLDVIPIPLLARRLRYEAAERSLTPGYDARFYTALSVENMPGFVAR